MADRHFHLYSRSGYQTLVLSRSLVGVEEEPGFSRILEMYGVDIAAKLRIRYEKSCKEVTLKPSVPKDKIKQFGKALANFAYSRGYDSNNFIWFWDHSQDPPEEVTHPTPENAGMSIGIASV